MNATPPDRGSARRTAFLIAGALTVAAVGMAILLTGQSRETATPAGSADASIALGDLPLVPIPATGTLEPPPGAPTVSAAASATPAESGRTAGEGVRALRIRIARLDIDLPIVEGDGVDAPIGKAAHYPGSAWPGAGSNTYLYGHAQEGMFINLWDAQTGDAIELDLADGRTVEYVVDEIRPEVPWDAVEFLQATDGEQLTLQTSTSYQPTAPRFIVIAYPAP
jgi:LPXTG-site transpeptidase (sortase) family protein